MYLTHEECGRQRIALGPYERAVCERIEALEAADFGARLWRKDPSLWSADSRVQASIRNALGWLDVAAKMEERLPEIASFVEEAGEAGFRHVVHMGMGGSSLAPLVFERTFARAEGGLALHVLDSTDPATVLAIEREVPLAETLFIVASKSGTTAEPNAFGEYFFERMKSLKGARAGENFAAITDPGTALEALARERGFRRTFLNFADIGGRYSALSYFGLVPIALFGVNVREVLARARAIVRACGPGVPIGRSPGALLGAALGELGRLGRDKLTLLVSDRIATFALWLEQLIAESTGKEGKGLLPVAGEPAGEPALYGEDRVFARLRLAGEPEDAADRAASALGRAGHPVITIEIRDPLDIASEFYRFEIATAVAGAVLGINPFDQPNVQESKSNTDRLLGEVRRGGSLPEERPALSEGPLGVFADGAGPTLATTLGRFFAGARPGDYVAILAYLTENDATERVLQRVRTRVRDGLRLATTVGYGPRLLHSTGQFHKGGPNTGLFIQLTAGDTVDARIPGQPYTFGTFKRAQALGDLEALRRHGRRAIRVHLGPDTRGLEALERAICEALESGAR